MNVNPPSKKPLVLYVDDDDMMAYLVSHKLEEFEIIRFSSGEEALTYLSHVGGSGEAEFPALILLDVNMPNKSGFEVLTAIRADPGLAHLPVAIFTASQNTIYRMRALSLGATSFIQKPAGLEELDKLPSTITGILRSVRFPPEGV